MNMENPGGHAVEQIEEGANENKIGSNPQLKIGYCKYSNASAEKIEAGEKIRNVFFDIHQASKVRDKKPVLPFHLQTLNDRSQN